MDLSPDLLFSVSSKQLEDGFQVTVDVQEPVAVTPVITRLKNGKRFLIHFKPTNN
jgi:hypothetical protein